MTCIARIERSRGAVSRSCGTLQGVQVQRETITAEPHLENGCSTRTYPTEILKRQIDRAYYILSFYCCQICIRLLFKFLCCFETHGSGGENPAVSVSRWTPSSFWLEAGFYTCRRLLSEHHHYCKPLIIHQTELFANPTITRLTS